MEDEYKASLAHVGRCPRFAELFRADSARALDPAAELRRVAVSKAAVVPEPVVAAPVSSATVASSSRRRRAGVVPGESARVPGPVSVEYWEVSRGLLG